VIGAAAAQPRSGGETLPGRIIPAVGLGKLRLGMSEAAARPVLEARYGKPRLVRQLRAGQPEEYREYEFPNEYPVYDIGVQGRPGKRRVVRISTQVAGNRTAAGIEVSSPGAKLRRAYPNLDCFRPPPRGGTPTYCVLGRRDRRNTVFVLLYETFYPHPERVVRIIVREPFVKLCESRQCQ
jgi:hypothetical protein